jgi:MurNAc alpha-1-phosphate uridylyltransferase
MSTHAQAMILAAGKGTRMQPHESGKPKPLVEIGGRPLIDYAFDLLSSAGISRSVVNTHHLAAQIENYLSTKPFEITLSYEAELLETGGGIKRALPLLEEKFFTLNSDVICIEPEGKSVLQRMAQHYDEESMDGLMLLCPLEKAVGYKGEGDFSLDSSGRIQPRQEGLPAYVYMGAQYLHRRFLDNSPEGAFSLSPLYKAEVAKGGDCSLFGMIHQGHWLHVGCPEGVALAEEFLCVSG